MPPEDELDALLASEPRAWSERAEALQRAGSSLAEPISAAGRLAALRRATPSSEFTLGLERRLQARLGVLAGRQMGVQTTERGGLARGAARLRGLADARSPWLSVAAVLVLVVIGSGLLLRVAASAAPGTPLYGLRQLEQHAHVQLARSAAERAQLHLTYAREALDALDAAVAGHASSGVYTTALDTFQTELRAASQAFMLVPPGPDHDAIATQLAQLTQRGRHDLQAALASIEWAERLATTRVLGQLGATIPAITSAQVVVTPHGAAAQWQITLQGSDFQSGAVLLLNEEPDGAQRTITLTQFQAIVEVPPGRSVTSVGIGNPDDTAAVTTVFQITTAPSDHGHQPTPTPTSAGGTPGHGGGLTSTPTPAVPTGK
jgi:hypothetical protein